MKGTFSICAESLKTTAPGASKTSVLSEPGLVTILNCSIINYNLVIIKMLL